MAGRNDLETPEWRAVVLDQPESDPQLLAEARCLRHRQSTYIKRG